MKTIIKNQVKVLVFQEMEEIPWIRHCFTTREGGVSKGEFASMNLSFTRGDDPEAVLENFKRVGGVLDTDVDHMVCSHQTHTTNILKVTKKHMGQGLTKPRDFQDIDGLITNEEGIVLATFYADCVPLYFIDTKHRAIGLSHSGWRGTVMGMGKKTLEAMKEAYGTNPEDVLCGIGPSICKSCYEVSEDVAEKFYEKFQGEADEILEAKPEHKYQLDLWEANRRILLDAGVKENQILMPGICTACNSELLFSHRASGGKRGNLGAFLGILEKHT